MGANNFSTLKVTEEIGKNKIKVMPDVLMMGGEGNGGPMNALLGFEMLKKIQSTQVSESIEELRSTLKDIKEKK